MTRSASHRVDGGQREREVEVVAVVDVSVLHELQVLVSHHLVETQSEKVQTGLDVPGRGRGLSPQKPIISSVVQERNNVFLVST